MGYSKKSYKNKKYFTTENTEVTEQKEFKKDSITIILPFSVSSVPSVVGCLLIFSTN